MPDVKNIKCLDAFKYAAHTGMHIFEEDIVHIFLKIISKFNFNDI